MSTVFQPRTLVIWGVAILAALWLGATAVAGVAKSVRPDVALAMPVKNGFAYEGRAGQLFGSNAALRDVRVGAAERADALAALRLEPLSSTALTILGLDRTARGDQAGGAALILRANRIDKRQLVANAWLINYHGTAGRTRTVLNLLDEALRVQPGLRERYMPALAQALADRETIPAFERMLRQGAIWEDGFWNAVVGNPAALPNAEILRSRLVAGPNDLGEPDTMLMAAFIGNSRHDLALSFGRKLPAYPEDAGNFIRNSSFNQLPKLPPLDWELKSDGRVSASIDTARGTLDLNAIAGSGAVVARQLIALAPGSYVLNAKLGRASLPSGSELIIHFYCAEGAPEAATRVDMAMTSDAERSFTIAEGTACRFYWVDVEFSALGASGPVLTTLAELRILHGRPQESTPPPEL